MEPRQKLHFSLVPKLPPAAQAAAAASPAKLAGSSRRAGADTAVPSARQERGAARSRHPGQGGFMGDRGKGIPLLLEHGNP